MSDIQGKVRDNLKILKDYKGISYKVLALKMDMKYTDFLAFMYGEKNIEDKDLLMKYHSVHSWLLDDSLLHKRLTEFKEQYGTETNQDLEVVSTLNNYMLLVIYNYLILKKGVSKTFLATRAGVNRQNLNRWLKGQLVTNKTLEKLLKGVLHTEDYDTVSLQDLSNLKLYIHK